MRRAPSPRDRWPAGCPPSDPAAPDAIRQSPPCVPTAGPPCRLIAGAPKPAEVIPKGSNRRSRIKILLYASRHPLHHRASDGVTFIRIDEFLPARLLGRERHRAPHDRQPLLGRRALLLQRLGPQIHRRSGRRAAAVGEQLLQRHVLPRLPDRALQVGKYFRDRRVPRGFGPRPRASRPPWRSSISCRNRGAVDRRSSPARPRRACASQVAALMSEAAVAHGRRGQRRQAAVLLANLLQLAIVISSGRRLILRVRGRHCAKMPRRKMAWNEARLPGTTAPPTHLAKHLADMSAPNKPCRCPIPPTANTAI